MTLVTSKPILVTGITGYLGAWIVKELLEKGYSVRGTTRSKQKFEDLCEYNKDFSKAFLQGKLENVIIEDIVSSSFEKAMEGIEIVLHTASPFHFKGGESKETYLFPALNGTLNVLKFAHKSGKIKKFIITSSFAAIFDLHDIELPLNGKLYNEKDWNSAKFERAENSNDPVYNYCTSKTIAEKAVYDYAFKHSLEFQICSINPPLIFGPWIHSISNLDQLNESVGQIYQLVSGKSASSKDPIPITHFPALVDVRDVAKAHILTMESKTAKGRFLIGLDQPFDNEWVCEFSQKYFPKFYKGPKIIEGEEKKGISHNSKCYKLDCSKAKIELGIKFINREKTFFDMISQMEKF